MSQIAADTPLEFLRWSARAIMEWPGVPELDIPVFAVHGERDRIIDSRLVRADEVISGGAARAEPDSRGGGQPLHRPVSGPGVNSPKVRLPSKREAEEGCKSI